MNDNDFESTNCQEQGIKKRSFVWNFFEKISRERVKCRLCKHEQNYQGTTGNILRHLRARHSLDATLKGQQDPENQSRITELLMMVSSGITSSGVPSIDIDKKPIKIRKRSVSRDSSHTANPYNDNETKEMSFENGNMFCENFQEHFIYNNKNEEDTKSAKKIKLEEDRISAETEYYRERAAYFRIQKHLTALQAKKIKLEIEEILSNKKNQT